MLELLRQTRDPKISDTQICQAFNVDGSPVAPKNIQQEKITSKEFDLSSTDQGQVSEETLKNIPTWSFADTEPLTPVSSLDTRPCERVIQESVAGTQPITRELKAFKENDSSNAINKLRKLVNDISDSMNEQPEPMKPEVLSQIQLSVDLSPEVLDSEFGPEEEPNELYEEFGRESRLQQIKNLIKKKEKIKLEKIRKKVRPWMSWNESVAIWKTKHPDLTFFMYELFGTSIQYENYFREPIIPLPLKILNLFKRKTTR